MGTLLWIVVMCSTFLVCLANRHWSKMNHPPLPVDCDYYCVLGVGKDATAAQLKKAYRKMMIKNHPDKNQGSKAAVETCQLINEAHSVLIRPDLRKDYDKSVADYCQFRIKVDVGDLAKTEQPKKQPPPFTFDPRKHEQSKEKESSHS